MNKKRIVVTGGSGRFGEIIKRDFDTLVFLSSVLFIGISLFRNKMIRIIKIENNI